MISPTSRPQGQKGRSMKVKLLGLTVASIVLASFYYGCAGVEQRPVMFALPTAGPPPQANVKRKTVVADAGFCAISFEEDDKGYLKENTLTIIGPVAGSPPGTTCTPQHTPKPLTVNGLQVKYVGPVQFTTEGTCRYCYINSSGGMSCVVMPGNC